jgi:hypothetical protein
MNEVEIPLKITGIAGIKAELRSLKDQIADATDPEQMAALADRAGELQKRLISVNNQISEFKKGSNFDQAKGALDGLTESLYNLDFSKASKESTNLNQTIKALKPEDLNKQFKGFASTILNVGKSFVSLGVTLLANPIFLIVAVVTAIVVAIGFFLKKMGLLDGVIKAIMAPINAVIQGFKDLTDWMGLTDNAAEENAEAVKESSEKNIENIKAQSKARQDLYNLTKDLSDDEIDDLEDRLGIEISSSKTIFDLKQDEIDQLQAENERDINALNAKKELTEEDKKRLEGLTKTKFDLDQQEIANEINRINTIKNLNMSLDQQIATLQAKQIKGESERAKAMLDIQLKEALSKADQQLKEAQNLGDTEAIAKAQQLKALIITDFKRQELEITNKGNTAVAKSNVSTVVKSTGEVESAQDKHLKEMRIKNKKAVDDATTAGKSKLEIAQLQIDQMVKEREEIEKLNLKKTKVFKTELERGAAVSEMNAKIKEATDKLEADKIKSAEQDSVSRIKTLILEEEDGKKRLNLQIDLIEEERKQKVANKELTEAQIKEINAQAVTDTKAVNKEITDLDDEKNLKILAAAQLVQETKLSNAAFELERFKGTTDQQIAQQEAFLTTTLATLDTQRIAELAALNLSEAEKEAIKEKYRQAEIVATEAKTAKIEEIEKAANDKLIASINKGFETAKEAGAAISSLQQINTDRKLKNVEKGSKEEEKILKQQFAQQKAMQLAMAAINGAQAILAILTVPDFTLGIASGIRIAASVAATAASISAIASTSFEGGGQAPGDPGLPDVSGITATSMATPSASLFGSNNNLNNVGAPQDGQGGQSITVNAIVSETQVTDVQNRINRIQRNAEL